MPTLTLPPEVFRIVRRRGGVVEKWRPPEGRAALELEAAVQRRVARAGLAPKVLSVKHAASGSMLVMEAVGRPFRRAELDALGHALGRLHRLSLPALAIPEVPPALVAYAKECVAAARWLGLSGWANALERRVVPWARGLERSTRPGALVLCHGDVKPSNLRLLNGAVRFIDFEAARIAEPAWELANAALTLRLNAREEDRLLETATAPAGRAAMAARFHAWRLLSQLYFPLDLLGRHQHARRTGVAVRGRSAFEDFTLHATRARELLTALGPERFEPLSLPRAGRTRR